MSVLIVGGGVAGLTAAMWLNRYGAPFRWVCAEGAPGGMLATVHNKVIDYPGVTGDSGAEVAAALFDWAPAEIGRPEHNPVESLEARDGFDVVLRNGRERFDCVLIATGSRHRMLQIPGEAEGLGRWVHTSTTRAPGQHRGERLLIVGGGDAAVEGALNLLDGGAKEVIVLARSPLRAQRQFVHRFEKASGATLWPAPATPTAFERRGTGCTVSLDDGGCIEVDAVFVRIGAEPVIPVISPMPDVDDAGFIYADGHGRTSVDGLFAAGDVTSTPLRSIATSVGDGSRAARAIAERLGIWT